MTYIVSTELRTLIITTNEEKAIKVYKETILSNAYQYVTLEKIENKNT